MLNNSFVEHCSDSVGFVDGSPRRVGPAVGHDLDTSMESVGEEHGLPPEPTSPTEPQAYSNILKRWFSGMTHDVDELDNSDDEYSSAESEGILEYTDIVGEVAGGRPPGMPSLDEGTVDAIPCPNCTIDNMAQFSAIILAMWDNVSGPANKHVWWSRSVPCPPSFTEKLLPFHPSCTLNGEVSRVDSIGEDGAEYKFYVLSEVGYAMGSFIFTAEDDEPPYALSLVIPLTDLSAYLSIQKLCINRMRHLIKKLQVLLKLDAKMSEPTIAGFTDLLGPFLTSISEIGIPSPISEGFDLQRTAFGDAHRDKFSFDFLALAITAHLESGGVCIVIGNDVDTINVMVETLAIFLREDECKQSRFAHDFCTRFAHGTSGEGRRYAPDLILQGVLQDEIFNPDVLMESTMPSTVINTKTRQVQQANRAEHLVRHAESEEVELKLLQATVKDSTTVAKVKAGAAAGAPVQQQPKISRGVHKEIMRQAGHEKLWDVHDKSPMVVELLHTVESVSGDPDVCQTILQHFCVGINRKANVVIQVVRAYQATAENPLGTEETEAFKTSVGLTNEADYDIVLAAAEKLRVGTYSAMKGDPLDMQDKVLGLFATF